MALQTTDVQAVVFDYGNTLIEFNHEQIEACDRRLTETLERHLGPHDPEVLTALRQRQRVAPYSGNPPAFRENNLADLARETVQTLYGVEAEKPVLDAILKTRFEAFVEIIHVEPEVFELLDELGGRYRLGLISNYPCGFALRESLKRFGLDRYFQSIVVSGDVGFVKPHELPFRVLCEELTIDPSQAVYIGDNWLADVQGAGRVGMQAVHMTRWGNPENFQPGPGDLPAHAAIQHLNDLLQWL